MCEPKRHSLLQVLTIISKCLGNGQVIRTETPCENPFLSSLSTLIFERDCSFLHYFLEDVEEELEDEGGQSEDEEDTPGKLALDRKSLFEGECVTELADASGISSRT